MLMTVLNGKLAIKQSKALIRTFKLMKEYISENQYALPIIPSKYLEDKFASYDKRFEKIEEKLEIVMDNFIDPTAYKHYLILNGEKIEADIAYQNIYKLAKQTIYIIDDYIDIKTLQLLKVVKDVNIIIFSDNKARNNLNANFISDFKNDTGLDIIFKENNNRFHDRYIIIDFNKSNELIYHCGASSKDAGNKITTICKIVEKELYKALIQEILNNQTLVIK